MTQGFWGVYQGKPRDRAHVYVPAKTPSRSDEYYGTLCQPYSPSSKSPVAKATDDRVRCKTCSKKEESK